MRFQIVSGGNTLVSGSTTDPTSPYILHNIQGWYDSSQDVDMEARAFSDGDVVIKKRKGSTVILMDISYYSEEGTSQAIHNVRSITDKVVSVRVTFDDDDNGRVPGTWEERRGLIPEEVELETISGVEVGMKLTIICPDQTLYRG